MILQGDCREVLATLDAESVDACITDPPYDLTAGKKGGSGAGGFMGLAWDATGVAFDPATWAAVLRVLKPGAHLLAFGGTRTHHRMVCAIEDAGFEIRDELQWLYGSGFPKSLDVSKAIDKAAGAEREVIGSKLGLPGYRAGEQVPSVSLKGGADGTLNNGTAKLGITAPATDAARQWEGWGTALKPACEPICLARKPLVGTVAANVLEHGTGALNIDGCRVEGDVPATVQGQSSRAGQIYGADQRELRNFRPHEAGRWPANVLLDEEAARLLDEQSGNLTSGSPGNSVVGPDRQRNTFGKYGGGIPLTGFGDTGGASRFFYVAKPSRAERGERNTHPTVKPVDLLRYLIRLVTPPGGITLDPFAGSGTTLLAAQEEGFRSIGIELNPEYIAIAERRLAQWTLWTEAAHV